MVFRHFCGKAWDAFRKILSFHRCLHISLLICKHTIRALRPVNPRRNKMQFLYSATLLAHALATLLRNNLRNTIETWKRRELLQILFLVIEPNSFYIRRADKAIMTGSNSGPFIIKALLCTKYYSLWRGRRFSPSPR